MIDLILEDEDFPFDQLKGKVSTGSKPFNVKLFNLVRKEKKKEQLQKFVQD